MVVLHPLLFAVFPVVSLYSANVWQVSFGATIGPMVLSPAIIFIFLLLVTRIFKNWDRAALCVTTILILILVYAYAAFVLTGVLPQRVVFVVWTHIMLVAVPMGVTKLRMNLRPASQVLCVVGACLIFIPTVQVVASGALGPSTHRDTPRGSGTTTPVASTPIDAPDIYYIILDRYASAETLAKDYGYDNSEFLGFLTANGFHIVENATANYSMTPLSLASSLNMRYLDDLVSDLSLDAPDYRPLYGLMSDNEVSRILQAQGYTYVHVGGSYWEPTRTNSHADVAYPPPGRISEFSSVLLARTTYLQTLLQDLGVWKYLQGHLRKDIQVKWSFEKLAEIPKLDSPKFVFAHFLLPHDPYVFDRHGKYVPPEVSAAKSWYENYLEQLIATNGMVEDLVTDLLQESNPTPIIILQADEGPYPVDWFAPLPAWFNSEHATEDELRRKMGILNAFLLPDGDYSALHSGVTPVNSFRIIFNLCFDMSFELLPDRSFLSVNPLLPYSFYEVTDRL